MGHGIIGAALVTAGVAVLSVLAAGALFVLAIEVLDGDGEVF